jgi:hypothetical protein
MRIVAADPGITGALAVYDHGTLESVHDMPVHDGLTDGGALGDLLKEWHPDIVVIERVQPMPRNGSIASFSLGTNYGIIIGVTTALSHPLAKLRPSEWKRRMGLLKKPKEASQRLAIELWPAHAPMFRLAKHHNRAEAALIARSYAFQAIHEENAHD